MRDGVPLQCFPYRMFVTQVHLFKYVLGMARDLFQIEEVPSIGQTIQIHQPGNLRALNDVVDEVGADEAGATGDQEIHGSRELIESTGLNEVNVKTHRE